ncbi:uncharacterized protein LOC114719485 [Neltuma alba]|uniref:uncharacterized protein LOC114719485 n=1 Tax=Neltuma alba TaxID=207710 RepID=UPI0010A31287|nr:uncharacterized protein LOC114719485 [Prosopis alba]
MPAFEEHERDFYDYEQEASRCGCFRVFDYRRWRQHEEEDDNDGGEGWLMNKLRRMKEALEVIARPKWKTFIRKMNCRKQNNRFQYDEHSYALNFNNGTIVKMKTTWTSP